MTGTRGTVMLWPDTFTNHFHPHVGQAAVEVLESRGLARVDSPTSRVCCGLTWISTGQLATGKSVLQQTVAALAEHVRAGGHVVGLEPSCTAVFRSDAPELVPRRPDVRRLSRHTVTLAELLTDHTPGWEPPRADGGRSSPRCTATSTRSWAGTLTRSCSRAAGADAEHAGVRLLRARRQLRLRERPPRGQPRAARNAPCCRALRAAESGAVVLADGFSCRTQIHELDSGGREAMHLAELLATAGALDYERPEAAAAPRPANPSLGARAATLAVAVSLAGAGAATAIWALTRRGTRR